MPNLRAGAFCALLWILPSSNVLGASVFAEDVRSFQPGPQNLAVPDSPEASHGAPIDALGEPDGIVVSLGERGQITLALGLPVLDGPGADLRVYENPLSFMDEATGETFVFAELAFVEVSSDGSTYARFPSLSPLTEPIGDFGVLSLDQVDMFEGLAGLRTEGDPFDFAALSDIPVVATGLVDLQAIRFVRLRDIVGDGSDFDSRGNPIFDPWPSDFESSGFDLDAVEGLHPIPEPSPLALLLLSVSLMGLRYRQASKRRKSLPLPA